MDVKKKHEIEAALATETQAISSGQLKEENPLDLSDEFRLFCEACRRGDLKVCQEMISTGVNINARDKFDYTPLILVSQCQERTLGSQCSMVQNADCYRPVCVGTTKSYGCCSRMAHCASETLSRASDVYIMLSTIAYATCCCPTTMRNQRTRCNLWLHISLRS